MVDVFIYISLTAAVVITAFAAYRDYKARTIDNHLTLALGGVFTIYAILRVIEGSYALSFVGLSLLAGFIILVACFLLFQANMLGGGDAKFAAALALFAGIEFMPHFLIIVALAGGIVALLTWASTKFKKADAKKAEVPYGIALSFAGMWVFSQHYYSLI